MRIRLNVFLFVMITGNLAMPSFAETIWALGEMGNSYAEYAIAGNYMKYPATFAKSPVFYLGHDKTETAWPFIHPGPLDVWAGSKAHTFTLQFDLHSAPKGVYRLAVHAASVHNNPYGPEMQVSINSKPAYTLHFQRGPEDKVLTDPTAGRRQTQSFLFTSSLLRKGSNTITLTITKGNWILYDAVTLESTEVAGAEPQQLQATSTPLFKQMASDLKQVVRVTVQNTGLEEEGTLTIPEISGLVQPFQLKQGSTTVDLFVPPYNKPTPHTVVLSLKNNTLNTTFEGRPARHWKIFVAPSTHTDIGYTDFQEKVFEKHRANTETMINACETNPDLRWNLETFEQAVWTLNQQGDLPKRLERLIQERRIGLMGSSLNMLTGICSGEELIRNLTPARQYARQQMVPLSMTTINDIPTTVGTLPMFLRQVGIRYFAEGINNNDRGPVWSHADKRMIQSPFWWEALDGSRVMAVFTRSYAQGHVLGLRDDVPTMEQRLPGWLEVVERPDYPGDAVYANGVYWDNEVVSPHFAAVAAEWNKTWAYPQIIVSRGEEFFEYVEHHYASQLPVFRGDMGSYWEDGAASSALETAMVRQAKIRLNSAARWEALAAAHHPERGFPSARFTDAWKEILYYDEHTWGAAGSVEDPHGKSTLEQWHYKAAYAQRATQSADTIHKEALTNALTLLASAKHPQTNRVTVWNDCAWPRDILVAVPHAGSYATVKKESFHPVSAFKQADTLYFLAKEVPAMGYRQYTLTSAKAPKPAPLLRPGTEAHIWESPRFRYRLNPQTGAFSSIEDLQTHREWIDRSEGYELNQYLYVTGGKGTSLSKPGEKPAPPLHPVSHTEATATLILNNALCAVLQVDRQGPSVSTVRTFYVIHANGQLDILNTIDKQETPEKEAGYFAFPIQLNAPAQADTYFDIPYGIVKADKEQLPGACRAWYAVNSFMAVSDAAISACIATREAPLFTIGTLVDGSWPGKLAQNHGTVFAYVFNNYWYTNYKAMQGGPMSFSFSVKLAEQPFDPVAATRFGWETQTLDTVQGILAQPATASHSTPHKKGTFLTLVESPILLTELKCNEQHNLVARFYNPSRLNATTRLSLPCLSIENAWKTDLGETERTAASIMDHTLRIDVSPRSIATYILQVRPKDR